MKQKDPESYKQGIVELETLIKELEGSEVDIDGLEEKVARAAHLVAFCRNKLKQTELSVNKIVSSLSDAPVTPKSPLAEDDSVPF